MADNDRNTFEKKVAKKRTRRPKEHRVYFIHMENSSLFKIGFTACNVNSRLKALQTGCPYRLSIYETVTCTTPAVLEKHLHECFSPRHVRGEWYNMTKTEIDDLVKFLRGE